MFFLKQRFFQNEIKQLFLRILRSLPKAAATPVFPFLIMIFDHSGDLISVYLTIAIGCVCVCVCVCVRARVCVRANARARAKQSK